MIPNLIQDVSQQPEYLIYAPPSGAIEYPYSIWRLRKDNPNVMFGENPSSADLAPFFVYWVTSTLPPEVDMRTHRVEEASRPDRCNDGSWVQAWMVRPATAEETAAWDAANTPQPDWMAFGIGLASHPGIAELYRLLPTPMADGLSIGLNEVSKGDSRLFFGLWGQLVASGAISAELLSAIAVMAVEHHLPAEFISGLAPAPESLTPPRPERMDD